MTCPVCQLDKVTELRACFSNGIKYYTCDRCGEFGLSALARTAYLQSGPDYRLAAAIRRAHDDGDRIEITKDSYESILSSIPKYKVTEKFSLLLDYVARKSQYPSAKVTLTPEFDFVVCFAASITEFMFYLSGLMEQGLIVLSDVVANEISNTITVTAKGWERLERDTLDLSRRRQVFVAMSFSENMRPVWSDAISTAIEACGYSAFRVDGAPHNDRIDVRIMSEIKKSRFVVADFTEQKAGVYFETGYAIGLGIPVIWCVNESDLSSVHFDTRQYAHLVWTTSADLKTKLVDYIRAIVGVPIE